MSAECDLVNANKPAISFCDSGTKTFSHCSPPPPCPASVPLTLNKWMCAWFWPCTWCHVLKRGQSLDCLSFIPYFVGCKLRWEHWLSVSLVPLCTDTGCVFLCSVLWQPLMVLTCQHVALCVLCPHSHTSHCRTVSFCAVRHLFSLPACHYGAIRLFLSIQ